MNVPRAQRGFSLLNLLLGLTLVAFAASVLFKLVPHYLDHRALVEIIRSVEEDPSVKVDTVGGFYTHVGKGMQINGIRDLKLNDVMKVTVDRNYFIVHLAYEQREPILKNIDLVVHFDDEYRVRFQ